MKKRLIPLIAIFALVFAVVPDAEANHCSRCRFGTDVFWCAEGTVIGFEFCDDTGAECIEYGDPCNHFGAMAPLASEYSVASVERLDDAPQPAGMLVAHADVGVPPNAQR